MCDVIHFNRCDKYCYFSSRAQGTNKSESLGRHHPQEAADMDLNSICLSQKSKPLINCVLMSSASGEGAFRFSLCIQIVLGVWPLLWEWTRDRWRYVRHIHVFSEEI